MSLQEYFSVFFYYKGITLKVAFQNEKHFENYRHNTVTERCSNPRNSSQLDIKELDTLYDQIVDYTNKKKEFRLLKRPVITTMDSMWGTERVNNTFFWMQNIICLVEKAGVGFDFCHYRYSSSDPNLSEEYANAIEKKNRLEHCPICQLKSTNYHCATCHQGYCGKDHQKKDWEVHKTNCKKIPKLTYSNNVYDNNKNYDLL